MSFVLDVPKVFFNIASFFLALVLLFFAMRRPSQNEESRLFRLFIVSVIISSTMETVRTLSYYFPYSSESIYLFPRIIQSLNFITSTFMLLSSTLYLNSLIEKPTKFSRVVVRTNVTVFAAYVVFCILNIRAGWIVGYDPGISLHDLVRGPLYGPVGYFVPVYMIASECVIFLWNIKSYPSYIRVTMLCSILISGVIMLIQPAIADYVSVVPFGATISLYLWYLAVENDDYKKLQGVIEKLNVANEEAAEANEAKNAFLTNMSHAIRTPLNAILGLDEMILGSSNPAEIREYAGKIYDSGKDLLSIINNILDYSKLESGKMEPVRNEYHMVDSLNMLQSEFEPLAREKGLDFIIECDEELSEYLYGDVFHISQILRNLIANAVYYTEKGGVTVRLRGTEKDGIQSQVYEIHDTGPGISDEDLDQLFKVFHRLDEPNRRDLDSAGLGLALCSKLTALLGGKVMFDTQSGVGTTFTLQVDQEIRGTETIGERRKFVAEQIMKYSGNVNVSGCNVLIVDDNSINLVVASGFLKKTGATVHTCESGLTCLELMKKEKYDIIFMDHLMPEMNGIETLRASRKMPGNLNVSTPVVVLTANNDPGMYDYYISQGFVDYVSKPIDREKLYLTFFRTIPQELIKECP